MNKKTITIGVAIVLVLVLGIFLLTKKSTKNTVVEEEVKVDLPINVLPIAERPFITLSPDDTGRS
jgi:hypothetical protein